MDITKRLGWHPGLPKQKPFKYFPTCGAVGVPVSVDLQQKMPAIYDQGDLGSCTAQAAAALSQYLMKKLGYKDFIPSRLAIYYWERVMEHTVNEDSGASLSDAIHVLTNNGSPNESFWWYNIRKFTVKPNQKVVTSGINHKIKQGLSVTQDLLHMKSILAEGLPFIFGFTVYDSFSSQAVASTGVMPMPKANERILGGHAVMAVGYDDHKQMFKIRNSWGTGWGLGGYFWMPYSFISNPEYASDMWTANSFATFQSP